MGFQQYFVFFVVQREENGQKQVITGISGFGFSWVKKIGRFVTVICFSKIGLLNPHIFIVFWGCALFGPSCQKRQFLDPPQKRKI